ncbi:hypothetical protein MTZ49_07250 [Entomomonas sp. E2T0]|uniref:hypothetical protein n=1 Tax=Entomomonas sp. E2T0 TaxID=2930213 RepID=UPI0022281759|nr:hypothetical protein [Entomomonas sp. E2T0]UYZ85335.1 hypothetical protein MTZ49_07250 [Entomomonas sp. E2T0]
MTQPIEITIQQGKTFNYGFKLADNEIVYRSISELINKVPVQLLVEDHSIPDNWPVTISCVKNPFELNTECPVIATVIDKDIIEINQMTVCCKRPYSGSGMISYYKPYDLTGFTARATIRPHINSKEIFYQWDQVIVDAQNHLIILQIPAEVTATFCWCNAIYDVEATAPSGEVLSVVSPSGVTIEPEVTR